MSQSNYAYPLSFMLMSPKASSNLFIASKYQHVCIWLLKQKIGHHFICFLFQFQVIEAVCFLRLRSKIGKKYVLIYVSIFASAYHNEACDYLIKDHKCIPQENDALFLLVLDFLVGTVCKITLELINIYVVLNSGVGVFIIVARIICFPVLMKLSVLKVHYKIATFVSSKTMGIQFYWYVTSSMFVSMYLN